MFGYPRQDSTNQMKTQKLLSDELQMKNLTQQPPARNGTKRDLANIQAGVSSAPPIPYDKTPTNSPLLVSNPPLPHPSMVPPVPARQDSMLTPGFPHSAVDVPASVASAVRPSLATSVIYEMVETDFNHFTVVPEMKLTTGVINKFNKLRTRNLQPLLDSLSFLHGTASAATNCSTSPVQVTNGVVTSADEGSNILPTITNSNHRRKKSPRPELEQHSEDLTPGSFSNPDLCPVEHRNSENSITSQAADIMEEMEEMTASLVQVQESLKKKEEEVKQLIESFHSERETLNATCGQLNQERFKLKRDNRILRDTVRKLESELQAMRRYCKCGCVPNMHNMHQERPMDPFVSPRNSNKSIKVEIPQPYMEQPQPSNQFPQIYRSGDSTSSKQSSSSVYSDACLNGSSISSSNHSNYPKSDPQLTGDTESYEEYEGLGSSSYSGGNTDVDYSSNSHLDSIDTVNKFSSSSTGSSALIPPCETSQVYEPGQNQVLNRQRSASAEQLVQPFATNSLRQAILNSGTPKLGMNGRPNYNPGTTAMSSPNLEPFLTDVKRENSGKVSPASSADSFRKLNNSLHTGLNRRPSVQTSLKKMTDAGKVDLSVSDEFSRSSGHRENGPLDVVVRHKLSVPIAEWSNKVLLDWLRLDLLLSKETMEKFQQNVKDVHTLLALKPADLKVSLGLDDKFQRRRLGRAIKFFIDYSNCKEPEKTDKRNLLKLDHEWMATFFLDFIGLSEYNRHFRHLRLDGLTLNGMNGEEIETMIRNDAKSNKHYKHCAASILFGWHLMRIMKFNTQKLEKRMLDCRNWDIDPLVWSNDRFYQWLKKQNFEREANNLDGLGVHGPLLVLSKSFTIERLFEKMRIRNTKESLPTRTNLQKKLEALLSGPRRLASTMVEEGPSSGQKESTKSKSVPILSP